MKILLFQRRLGDRSWDSNRRCRNRPAALMLVFTPILLSESLATWQAGPELARYSSLAPVACGRPPVNQQSAHSNIRRPGQLPTANPAES
jgi:hypothetical protein